MRHQVSGRVAGNYGFTILAFFQNIETGDVDFVVEEKNPLGAHSQTIKAEFVTLNGNAVFKINSGHFFCHGWAGNER
jgi:hypothetical protein